MKISVLSGATEIGSNKILIEHKNTRIFLDFGMSFDIVGQYYSEFLQPRKCNSFNDFFEFGLLPDMPGIYRNDYLKHIGRKDEERSIDAILLSHAHMDHAQYIHFIRPDIPIGCTRATKTILEVLEETGMGTFNDLVTQCESFAYYTNKRGGLSRVTRRNKDFIIERIFNIMTPNKRWTIKDLEVEMVPVDHSLPGACGYIIYSDEGNLVYTGDFRFHGSHSNLARQFVEKAIEAKPKWLLCEGTRIDDPTVVSEKEVQKVISKKITDANGLVFVEHPARDLDRITTIFKAAQDNNRDFVVSPKLAYLIRAFNDINICPFTLDDVKILIPKKSWGLINKIDIHPREIIKDYKSWERDFIFRENAITATELQTNPSNYVVSMNIWEMGQLIDIRPTNAIWIKSSCEPFCPEMELDEERKQNWLKHFNIREFFAHASGHASGPEIIQMIREINAEHVIPIHTEYPEKFEVRVINNGRIL